MDLIIFTIPDGRGRAFEFRGRIQTGGIAARLLGGGSYRLAGTEWVKERLAP